MCDETEDKLAVISMVLCGVLFILGLLVCVILAYIFGKLAGLGAFGLMLVAICILLLKTAKKIMNEKKVEK